MNANGYTGAYADPRLPLAPLWAVVARGWRPGAYAATQPTAFGTGHLAAACGVHCRTAQRWHTAGLTWDAADKAACAIGLHAANIWGSDFWASVPAEDVA